MLPCIPSSSSVSAPSDLSPVGSMREHPLENAVILRELFQYFPQTLDSVKNRRLVSKAWNRASELEWKSLGIPLTIFQNEKEQKRHSPSQGTTTLSQFLEEQSAPKKVKFPPNNLLLKNWLIDSGHLIPDNQNKAKLCLEKRFWRSYTQNITALTLNGCGVPWKANKFEEPFLEALPNMEILILLDCKFMHTTQLLRLQINEHRAEGDEHAAMSAQMQLLNARLRSHGKLLARLRNASRRLRAQMYRNQLRIAWLANAIGGAEPLAIPNLADPPGAAEEIPLEIQNVPESQQPRHEKLKFIRVQNLQLKNPEKAIPWSALLKMFPNLEEISIRYPPKTVDDLLIALENDAGAVSGSFRTLDIMESSRCATEKCSQTILKFNWSILSLQKLTLDCGFRTSASDVQKILETQADTLKELHLYRAPFSSPYNSFPCHLVMSNLTKLNLWGNVSSNMDFLGLMPKLKILKWNFSCYEESTHGSRLHKHLKQNKSNPVFSRTWNIVENSNKLAVGFKLDSMEALQLECGPISISMESWEKLGAWMPRLKRLKGTVNGDEQLIAIGKQWPDIELLELAHGSLVSDAATSKALSNNEPFQKLQSFIWKPCPCIQSDDVSEELPEENDRDDVRKFPSECEIPFKKLRTENQQTAADHGSGMCLQDLFEKAVDCGAPHGDKFFDILNESENM